MNQSGVRYDHAVERCAGRQRQRFAYRVRKRKAINESFDAGTCFYKKLPFDRHRAADAALHHRAIIERKHRARGNVDGVVIGHGYAIERGTGRRCDRKRGTALNRQRTNAATLNLCAVLKA